MDGTMINTKLYIPGMPIADVAAKTGVILGGTSVNPQGIWSGQRGKIKDGQSGSLMLQVVPASATMFHFYPAK